MLNTVPYTSLAGTVWIEIDAGATTNGNLQVLDMGTIDYEFDLIPSDQDIKSIGGMPGATSVVFDDAISNRGSLYESLLNSFITIPKATATIYLRPRGENFEYKFPFEFTFIDMSIDEKSQKTTIGFSPRTSSLNVGEWANQARISNVPSRMSFESGQKFFVNSWASGDFIYNVVEQLDNTATENIYKSGILFDPGNIAPFTPVYVFERLTDIINSPTNIQVSDYSSLMFVHDPDMYFANANSVFSKVQSFAGMEGAIFGSAFNINYYINRNYNTINVELTNSDLSLLRFSVGNRDISNVRVSFSNTNKTDDPTVNIGFDLPKITNVTGGVGGWPQGSREFATTITGFYPQLNRGVYDVTDNYVNGDNNPLAYFNDLALAGFGASVYSKATDTTSRYKIEIDVLGVDKVKPHEVIRFNETVPSRYWGKHFRPTSLSYDLKADRVRITAYEIDTFEFTPPQPPPPQGNTNIQSCENGTYMTALVYATNATADMITTEDNGNYMLFSVYATNATADMITSEENGNYMAEQVLATNTIISASSETNQDSTSFTTA